jgi:urea transporter/murein DD-endopeptidase MepM/ murein hydrolase activator NlpD
LASDVSDVAPTRSTPGPRRIGSAIGAGLEAALRPYGLIVFASGLWPGLFMLLAICVFPRLALATMGSVVVAAAATLIFGYGTAAVRQGGYGCTAVLTTLAIGVFSPEGGNPYLLVVVGAVLSVFVTGALESLLRTVALPAHALPFVIATFLVHLASRSLPVSGVTVAWIEPAAWIPAGWLEPSQLDMPAAIVFLHGALPGLLVLFAVLSHSRIAFLLAAIGLAVTFGVHAVARAGAPWSMLDTTAAFNGLIAAMAIGGIWFVPHPSSLGLAVAASVFAVLITYALFPALGALGLPVVSLPFVLAVHLVLTAARQRQADRHPHSAPPAERPEEALVSHLDRVRQLGTGATVRFQLPFRGEWFVSQGVDGSETHRDAWRHGIDFDIRGSDGAGHERGGGELSDYRCYGLPVLSTATGTVALVVDGVPDNRPGSINTTENWGNAIVVVHGPGLYSVYAHLQSGSARVKLGDVVSGGMVLGKCGNSGRSATPHLHFQLQREPKLGSATIPVEFVQVVTREAGGERLRAHHVPIEGTCVRPVVADDSIRRALDLDAGTELSLVAENQQIERATVALDLLGNVTLESDRARLTLRQHAAGVLVTDYEGRAPSLLRHLVFALGHVTYDQAPVLEWEDRLPRRLLVARVARGLLDLASAVVPVLGAATVRYRSERRGNDLEIVAVGTSFRATTRVVLSSGVREVAVDYGSQSVAFTVVPVPRAERRAA